MIHTIAVCGAGTMGAGIAQVSATAGYYTLLFDTRQEALDNGIAQISHNLRTAVKKGRLEEQRVPEILSRIRTVNDAQECIAEVIIEAIVESIPAKIALFNQLAEINHSDTIFATNTSSLSVSAIAQGIVNPARVAGMHFFNPAHLMQLVEIVSGKATHESITASLSELAKQMGKTPVHVKDAPGFIVNRVARHYYLEAMQIAEDGVCDIRTADRLLESAGFRMGPFALMDLIGNDVNYAVTCSLYEAFDKAPRFRPGQMQADKVARGELGRKTGKGFYEY
ncbi:3-hydroxyacyl-CoA dehydrogenase family protein [Chitinophaga sp. XS-30]|uniref:3-hydroxyacyl-CoA dehydrogenase family protein n=1 Tax=Chitinophaga sp. XS-30 TaxID=2604421 RepID=UPI0011DD1A35|nr:3-hydroxyacyl-CoA dehydrogenase NAD-binding domain-containing protein [Chitinophaga sp. XS-30]QEH40028.1 3-hydroxybutyryl-CoA dehydrogenase [Chitinophaga sp. XS-30]